jgi:FKBP-type peptidyl-prolyl cis-trans isomerase 2
MFERSPSLLLITILIVAVVVAAGVGGGVLYERTHPAPPAGPPTVAVGDNVTVNYIGIFGSGPEEGLVFDTSIQSVANNNATYPKSVQFSPRLPSQYTPLPVHVGPGTPEAGYTVGNYTFEGVVTGFWEGLIGLAVNQTRYATVPPALGYGSLDQSCLQTVPLSFTVPVIEVYSPSQFNQTYPGVEAQSGVGFTDPVYGWPDLVYSANASAVVVENTPNLGWSTSPNGWAITVTNLSSTTITLTNELTPANAGLVGGTATGPEVCGTSQYIVWSVNLGNSTYVRNFNREVVGETLIFVVTIVAINPT